MSDRLKGVRLDNDVKSVPIDDIERAWSEYIKKPGIMNLVQAGIHFAITETLRGEKKAHLQFTPLIETSEDHAFVLAMIQADTKKALEANLDQKAKTLLHINIDALLSLLERFMEPLGMKNPARERISRALTLLKSQREFSEAVLQELVYAQNSLGTDFARMDWKDLMEQLGTLKKSREVLDHENTNVLEVAKEYSVQPKTEADIIQEYTHEIIIYLRDNIHGKARENSGRQRREEAQQNVFHSKYCLEPERRAAAHSLLDYMLHGISSADAYNCNELLRQYFDGNPILPLSVFLLEENYELAKIYALKLVSSRVDTEALSKVSKVAMKNPDKKLQQVTGMLIDPIRYSGAVLMLFFYFLADSWTKTKNFQKVCSIAQCIVDFADRLNIELRSINTYSCHPQLICACLPYVRALSQKEGVNLGLATTVMEDIQKKRTLFVDTEKAAEKSRNEEKNFLAWLHMMLATQGKTREEFTPTWARFPVKLDFISS